MPVIRESYFKKSQDSEYDITWGEKMQRKRKNDIDNMGRVVDRMEILKELYF